MSQTIFYDINRLPENGFLVLPLSMSRLASASSPQALYEFFEFMEPKLQTKSVDVVMLYTNDLYCNSEENGYEIRQKLLHQMLNHKSLFQSLIVRGKRFIPSAFHFLPWDYVLLNGENFNTYRSVFLEYMKNDAAFDVAIQTDINRSGRKINQINVNFLIEEMIVCHFIMDRRIEFPHRLATNDGWRLICYPGKPPETLGYFKRAEIMKENSIPKTKVARRYANSFYDMEAKVLLDLMQNDRGQDSDSGQACKSVSSIIL